MKVNLPARAFAAAVKAVAVAASTDDCRPVLCGVELRFTGDQLRLSATDAYRLHVLDLKLDAKVALSVASVVVPAGWLLRWSAARKRSAEDRIDLWTSADKVSIVEGSESASIDPIASDYPNVTAFLDQPSAGTDGETAVNPAYLKAAITAADLWGSHDKFPAPMRVHSIDPMKPCRFRVDKSAGTLHLVVMPVRVA